MSFYAHPTPQISPGDIFPSIPFSVLVSPLKIARNEGYTPAKGRGPADFRRIFTLPNDQTQINNLRIDTTQGEETVSTTRSGMALFLTWGSEVESTERRIAGNNGKAGKRSWLAAPIYRLHDIPATSTEIDPDTNESVPMRDLIRSGKARDNFFLPPFPGRPPEEEYYAELRKITPIGVEFFQQSQGSRLATLTMESLNEMYSHLLWSLTRAELFFRPIRCECGRDVPVDVRIHGQNTDAEAWAE
jgi:hypothetical protein